MYDNEPHDMYYEEPDELEDFDFWRFRRYRKHQQDVMQQIDEGVDRYNSVLDGPEPYSPFTPDNLSKIACLNNMPQKGFFLPRLENQPIWVQVLGVKLTDAVDGKNITKAEEYLNQLKALGGMDTAVNQQFIKTQQIKIMQFKKAPKTKIRALIKEAFHLTVETFDFKTLRENDSDPKGAFHTNLNHMTLIRQEAELLYLHALEYEREGNNDKASDVLEKLMGSIDRQPYDPETLKLIPKLLLSLAVCQIKNKNYEESTAACEEGRKLSATRLQGQYTTEFLLIQSKANEKAADIKHSADYLPYYQYNCDQIPTAETFGDLIRALRTEYLRSHLEIASGICNPDTLLAIESGEEKDIKPLILTALLERLGIDINLFGEAILSGKDFINEAMKDKVEQMIKLREYDEAAKFLHYLEIEDGFTEGINRQFIESAKATALINKIPQYKRLEMIIDSLKITCPIYSESNIKHLTLTDREAILIGQVAVCHGEAGDMASAVSIFEKLYLNLSNRHKHNIINKNKFLYIMFNYTRYLGMASLHDQSIAMVEKAEDVAIRTGKIYMLPMLIFNKAYSLFKISGHEKSVPYFKEAYALALSFTNYGHSEYIEIMRNYVKEHLDIDFT